MNARRRWNVITWLCLALLSTACFGGDFVQGLPCDDDDDCGPQLTCNEGLCGGPGQHPVCGNLLLERGEECDDGNTRDDDDCSSACIIPPPEVPTLELHLAAIKQFEFSWGPVVGADYHQLLESVDVGEPFTQLGPDIVGESVAFTMPLHLRANAAYKLRSCNALRCSESEIVSVMGGMVEAIGRLKAPNADPDDGFGGCVALSADGKTLAVGASGEDSNATGINGAQADNSAILAGAVYVFVRDGELDDGADGESAPPEAWSQVTYVKASNTDDADGFGGSVALSADGNTLVVGATGDDSDATGIDGDPGDDDSTFNSGAVYVFVRSGTSWSQQAYIKASNTNVFDRFGESVALSDDGETLAVGASAEDGGVAGINGDPRERALVPYSGAVYVFVREDGQWSQQAYVKASTVAEHAGFGTSVALSGSGQTLAVGAPGENSNGATGRAFVFARIGGHWHEQASLSAPDSYGFGTSVALSGTGEALVIGAVWAFGSDKRLGKPIAIGAAYVFAREGERWSFVDRLDAREPGVADYFGQSVAISADGLLLSVGAPLEDSDAAGVGGEQDDEAATDAGAVYVFRNEGGHWRQHAYVKAANAGGGDRFGTSVAMAASGQTLVVGAPFENRGHSNAEPPIFDSGAVFLY